MSNFFPNKPADAVLVDMINAYYQSNAQRADFTFGNPIVNDNPFVNTVMSVTVNSGPLVGRLSEIYYKRLSFDQLLSTRNINIADGNYTNVSDLLPLIKQDYNIDIQSGDIADSSIAIATTEETPLLKTIRLVASANSLAFYGAGNVHINKVTVSNWMSFINIDEDYAMTLFPMWESGYPMTGFKVSFVEQGVPIFRQYLVGFGLSYNGTYQIADSDNTFELTVATAESWAFDAVVYTSDFLPIHDDLNNFPFIPFIKIILLNPMNGFENLQPLKFIHVPDLNRTGLRTWRVAGQTFIPPAHEYNQDGVYVSRTRIVDESYQPPTNFGSVMDYFNTAIGNNGTHFNEASFEIQLGLEDLSGVVQAVESTYFNIRHFLQQSTGTWNLVYNDFADAEMAVFGAVGGDGFLRMKPNGFNISPKNFQGFTFTKGGTSDRFDILTRVVKGDGSVVQDATSLVDANKDYVLSLSPATENYFVDLIFASEMPMMTTSTQPGLEFSIVDASNNVVATRTLTGTIMFNGPDYGLSFIDDLFITSYDSGYYNPDGAPSGEFNMVQLRLSRADLLYTLLGWEVPPPSSNYRIRLKPFISQSVGRLDLATDPSVETLFGGSIDIVVSET